MEIIESSAQTYNPKTSKIGLIRGRKGEMGTFIANERSQKLRQLLLQPYLAFSLIQIVASTVGATEQAIGRNVTYPLIYHRLRHDDNYLQLFRKYQLEHPFMEKTVQLRFNQTLDGNQTKEFIYNFYENNQIEASSITQDDLILEALDRTYKTRLFQSYIYNYDDPDDKRRASDPKLVSSVRCNRELDYLMKKVTEYERAQLTGNDLAFDPELAAYFDSFATEETGLLFGNYHWTGNWRQCAQRLIFSNSDPANIIGFTGRYCIASIKSRNWAPKIEKKVDELLKNGNYFKYPEQQYDYARFFRIQVGICLPESCDSKIIDQRRDDVRRMTVLRLHEPFKEYKMFDLFCLPDESSEFRRFELSGLLFLLATFIWCSLIFGTTIIDSKRQKTRKIIDNGANKSILDKLVLAMSLIENFKRITNTKSLKTAYKASKASVKASKTPNKLPLGKTTQKGYAICQQEQEYDGKVQIVKGRNKLLSSDMIFLNALKVVSMPIIIFGHVVMLGEHLNRFPLDFNSLQYDFLFHWHNSGVFLVDWYFVITGFVTTYLLFITKKVKQNSIYDWAYMVFHRYWRLAPIYIILFWFSRSIFFHVASGPIWDYGTSNMTLRSICRRESWLWPITLTSNLHPLHEECIMPAWYLASDMQFFMITPPILVLLHKSPIWGWLLTLTLIGASIAARIHRYLTDPRVQPLELLRPRYDLYMRNNWDMHPTYLYPQYRIPPYLIGILAAHYTYMVLSGQWRSILYISRFPDSYKSSETKTSKRIKLTLRTITWFTGLSIICFMSVSTWFSIALFPRSLEPFAKYAVALMYGLSHTTSGLGVALLVVTFMLGQFPKIKVFLSHPIWTLISRLNFGVFLIQVEVIYWIYQSSERVIESSARNQFKFWVETTFISYSISAVVTIFLEYPLVNLDQIFIGNWVAKMAERASPHQHGRNHGDSRRELILSRDYQTTGNHEKFVEPSTTHLDVTIDKPLASGASKLRQQAMEILKIDGGGTDDATTKSKNNKPGV